MKLGAQLYSVAVRLKTQEDVRATFLKMKEIGYENVQLSGFAPQPAEFFRDVAEESGLPIVVTHFDFNRIVNDTENLIKEHKIFDCPTIGIGSMPGEYRGTKEGLDAFLKIMEEPVKKIEAAGLHFSYHNHSFEFEPYKDAVGCAYDDMLEKCPSWYLLLDTCWVANAGRSVEEYIRKVGRDRLVNIHFKDMVVPNKRPENNTAMCACGEGALDFAKISKVCEEIGVVNALVEQDNASQAPDPYGEMEKSFKHLRPLIK